MLLVSVSSKRMKWRDNQGWKKVAKAATSIVTTTQTQLISQPTTAFWTKNKKKRNSKESHFFLLRQRNKRLLCIYLFFGTRVGRIKSEGIERKSKIDRERQGKK